MVSSGAPAEKIGPGARHLPHSGPSESERGTNVLVSVGDSALPRHAELHQRVVFTQLPRGKVPAGVADAAGHHGRSVALAPALASSRTALVAGDAVGGAAFGPPYPHSCADCGAHPERTNTSLVGGARPYP